jgi:hypothetical protein
VRDNHESAFITEIAVENCEDTFADKPFEHVKNCG